MIYLQCQDEDCKTIFQEDKVFEWKYFNKILNKEITLIKCPLCRGKLKEIDAPVDELVKVTTLSR